MVKIYKQPFAHDGDTIAIPDASQPDGKMSSADGWTPDYQLPKTDPNYKPFGRQEMNGVFREVTEALGQVQVQGSATWSADGAPYPVNAQVYHNGKQWIALRANSVEPVEGEDWKGALRPATPAQAQALTAGDVVITPETLAAAFKGSNHNISANGYQKLPSGLIIQWAASGTVSIASSSSASKTVTFPIAFPNQGISYWASISGPDVVNISGIPTGCYALSTTQMSVAVTNLGTTPKNLTNILCFAIGY